MFGNQASRRCEACDIAYPNHLDHKTCEVCGGNTVWTAARGVDPDWREKVLALTTPAVPDDKVYRWRYDALVRAEYTPLQAMNLATNRAVDLHKAVALAEAAGASRAFDILS